MSRVIAPDGKVETFAWLAWPSFMMEPLPKLASISPRTRSSAFFLASRSAELFDSDAGRLRGSRGLGGLGGLGGGLGGRLGGRGGGGGEVGLGEEAGGEGTAAHGTGGVAVR